LRRAKLARTPTGHSPHFNSKAATALPRAHSRSARTTSDTSVSSRSGSRPVPYPVGQSGRWVCLKFGAIELAGPVFRELRLGSCKVLGVSVENQPSIPSTPPYF
jgi:hypothetical protein